jgi:hypothetical protein
MRRLRAALIAQGFTVEMAKSGHYRVIAPSGAKCQIPATPRHNRAVLNAVTRLRRIGFQSR